MRYIGDFRKNDVVRFLFSTNAANGASAGYTGGTFHAYKDGASGTEVTAGVTVTPNFDGMTGVHLCVVDTGADALYANASDIHIVGKALTIDGQAVSAALAHFSLRNRFGMIDQLLATAVDGTHTVLRTLMGMAAVLMNKSTGNGLTFRDQADGKNRVSFTVDGSKNRTTVSYDFS